MPRRSDLDGAADLSCNLSSKQHEVPAMLYHRIAFAVALLGASVAGLAALAQDARDYPSKTIHIVVANAAGGGTDYLARIIGQKMSERMGQSVIVENKPGANSTIAAQALIKSPPDGHTLLMGSIGMLTVNPAVVANLSYDTQRDFAPISIVAEFPLILTVNASAPIRSVAELVAYAKANPAKANAGASGPIFQVVQKMFELRTGTNFQYISYRAISEAMIALMRGDILMSLSDIGPATGPIQDGRVRPLAVTSGKRLASYPDVPTMAEAGIKDMEVEFWQGLVAPAATPKPIIKKLEDELIAIVKLPDIREKMIAHEQFPVGGTAEQYAAVIARELKQWKDIAVAGNIKIE
jgi:tripartite-type tricarboxylate transporter receptor subunit TctC